MFPIDFKNPVSFFGSGGAGAVARAVFRSCWTFIRRAMRAPMMRVRMISASMFSLVGLVVLFLHTQLSIFSWIDGIEVGLETVV